MLRTAQLRLSHKRRLTPEEEEGLQGVFSGYAATDTS
jgi:hypothetical protein